MNTTVDELDFVPNDRCSLREAVVTVNEQRAIGVGGCSVSGTLGSGDVIVVPEGLYRLTRISYSVLTDNDQDFDNLNVRKAMTIRGAGAGLTIIDGEGLFRPGSYGTSYPLANGGVVHVEGGATATIEGITIRHGEAYDGGGVYVAGSLTIRDSAVEHNASHRVGSGIYSEGNLTLERVTIADNGPSPAEDSWPSVAGGIYTGGALDARNVTVSGNEAGGDGGIVVGEAAGLTILHSVTIFDNAATDARSFASAPAGGIRNRASAETVRIQNSIIAGNRAPGDGDDCIGDFDSRGYNLIGQLAECSGFSGDDLRGSVDSPLDPVLAPLGLYGGLMRTHALLSGSPAVDAGPLPITGDCLAEDQRGFPRGVDGDLNGFVHCDIGAFEAREGLAAEANLQLFLFAEPDPVAAGSTITYNVSVKNHGPLGASGVEYVLTLPSGAGQVTSLPAGCTAVSGKVTCDVGTMGEHVLISHLIDVTAPSTTGAVIAEATVSSTSDDPEPGDDSAQISTRVVPASSADLWLTMYADAGVVMGDSIEFVVVAGNNGPQAADGTARVTNFLPQNATFEAADGCGRVNNIVTCSVAGLAPGANREFRIVVKAPNQLTHVTNTASVAGASGSDTNIDNNSATFTTRVVDPPPPSADLAIQKSGPSTAQVGTQIAYNLIVRNNGPDTAEDVRVTDLLPAGMSVVSLPSGCVQSGQTLSCGVGALEPNETRTLTLSVSAPNSAGEVENVAGVVDLGGTVDPNPLADEASAFTTITEEAPPPGADLAVTKNGPLSVQPGGAIRYGLVVSNNGPDAAEDVTLTDNLPAGVTFVAASDGCDLTGSSVVCEVGSLATGSAASFTVDVMAPDAEGDITNTVSVTSETDDPVSTNDSDSVSTSVSAEAPVGTPQLTVAPHPDSPASLSAQPGEDGVVALRFTATATGDEAVVLQGLSVRVIGQSGGAELVDRIELYGDPGQVPLSSGTPSGGNEVHVVVLDVPASEEATVAAGTERDYVVLVDVGTDVAGNPGGPLLALAAVAFVPLGLVRGRRRFGSSLIVLAVVAGLLVSCFPQAPDDAKPRFQLVVDTVTAVGTESGVFAAVGGVPLEGPEVQVVGGE